MAKAAKVRKIIAEEIAALVACCGTEDIVKLSPGLPTTDAAAWWEAALMYVSQKCEGSPEEIAQKAARFATCMLSALRNEFGDDLRE